MADKDDSYDKLQKVKSEIRSLLISCPTKSVPLNGFLKDFQQNIGKPLPFKNFNYHTPLQFLHSLSDVVRVIDASDGARLAPVANELSSHISQMVVQQKKNSNRRNLRRPPPPRHFTSYAPPKTYGPPQPFMGSYTQGRHIYHYPTPMVPVIPPLFPPQVETYCFQPSAYPTYGFTGNPAAYNASYGAQQFPTVHPASVPYSSLRGLHSSPSDDKVSRVENDNPSKDNANKLKTIVSEKEVYNELDKSISFNINRHKQENDCQVSPKQTFNAKNADDNPKIEKSPFTVPNSFVAKADSTVGDNVGRHASVDIQSNPEDQHSSPSSLSGGSRCSNVDNGDFKSKIRNVLEKYTNGVSSSAFLDLYESLHSCSLDLVSLGYSSLKEMVLKNEDVFSFEKHKCSDDWILYDARLKPRRRHIQEEGKTWIPHSVLDNLAALARNHPNGIDASEILSHYKAEFSTDINPEMLGFDGLYSLLESCKSILFKKYNESGVVYPKDWVFKSRNTNTLDEMQEPALPPVEQMKLVWRDYFKENECNPTFKYKPPFIPEEKLFQVKVVDLHSPALMWIQCVDDVKSLSNLMCQMNIHYDREHQDYCVPEDYCVPGLAVASMFAGKWHRALVLSVNGVHAEVLYVDYGTSCTVNISELRKLDRRFGKERLHAIKASLFCLVPHDGDEWSVESCEFLYTRYAEKIVFAEICSVNYQDSFVEVIFYDTSKGEDININDLLVSEKLARYLTNPASILNERSIAKIYKFFPRWFSLSDRSDSDMSMCYKNVLLSTAADSIPINSDVIPCCKSHCIQTLYQANSEAMSLIWERSVRQEEERILNNVIQQVEDALKEWGWESCITAEVCCVDNLRHKDPSENHRWNDLATLNPIHPETSAQPIRRPPTCKLQNNGVPEIDYSPLSRSSSVTGFNHARRNEGMNLATLNPIHPETSAQPIRRPPTCKLQNNGVPEIDYSPLSRSSSVTGFNHARRNEGMNLATLNPIHPETSAQPIRRPPTCKLQNNGVPEIDYSPLSRSSSVTGFNHARRNEGMNLATLNPIHPETSAQPIRRPPTCKLQNNGVPEIDYSPLSRSSSVTGFNHARRNEDRSRIRPHPRTVRYVDAEFRGKPLTLISFKGEIRVCLSQLFQLTKLPSMLARKRLEISHIKADLVLVTPDNHPDLYLDLSDLELNSPDEKLCLVLLSDAPKIIGAVDPVGAYRDTFESLAKEVAPYLEKLCCQDTSAPT